MKVWLLICIQNQKEEIFAIRESSLDTVMTQSFVFEIPVNFPSFPEIFRFLRMVWNITASNKNFNATNTQN